MLRKLGVFLLTAAMLIFGTSAACAEGLTLPIVLINDSEIHLEITNVQLNTYSDGDATLRFDACLNNRTGRTLNLFFRDVCLDGTEAKGVGMMECCPGVTDDDYFFFKALDGESNSILEDPQEIAFRIEIKDDETYELVRDVPVYLSGPLPSPLPTATGGTQLRSTPAPTTGPIYTTLRRGDSGAEVERLQRALNALGYNAGTVDGDYGAQTARAVSDFREINGLNGDSDVAESFVLELLYSGKGKAYVDPEFALEIFSGASINWKAIDNDQLKIRVQVRNASRYREVKAFEIYMYATDVWGERIYGENWIYYETTNKKVAPGETVYSTYFVVPDFSRIDQVHFGIHRIAYSDGSTVEADSIDYWYWSLGDECA